MRSNSNETVYNWDDALAQLRAEVASMRAEVEAFAVELTELRLDVAAFAEHTAEGSAEDPPAR